MRARAAPLGLLLLFASAGRAAAADADTAVVGPPPVWLTDARGARFRVRFDPGERLILGAGAETLAGGVAGLTAAPGLALEFGLLLRGERPAPGWDVHWKRNHEIFHLRLRPHAAAGARGAAIEGALYRGIFLRQSREGTLTLPVTPPRALPLPFDVGVRIEVGRLHGALSPEPGGPPIDAGVFNGEVLADFWRSRQPGRWLTVGIGGRYEVGLRRDDAGGLLRDHRVSPMSTLALAFHSERADGLAAGGVRAEASHRWSSARGWERAYRVDADFEVTPLAANDRPLALFAIVTADTAPDLPHPELRAMAGIRFSQPLR